MKDNISIEQAMMKTVNLFYHSGISAVKETSSNSLIHRYRNKELLCAI